MRIAGSLLLVLGLITSAFPQDVKPAQAHPGVDQEKVDKAIDDGAKYLLSACQSGVPPLGGRNGRPDPLGRRMDELVLYTLFHAGVKKDNAVFARMLKQMLARPLLRTYHVALQAMVLSELDARKYQWRIAQCCQFLVDNQTEDGNWGYGRPTEYPKDVPTAPAERDDVATGKGPATKRPPENELKIRRQRFSKEIGDNSNSQYAALGLRACLNAKVIPPKEALLRGLTFWLKKQNRDGGFAYDRKNKGSSYGSMSAGALSCLVIYAYHLKKDWKRLVAVKKGVQWMASNMQVDQNPKHKLWPMYWLYAVERAGMLTGLLKFGKRDWYLEGATFLLKAQNTDGSWTQTAYWGGAVKDTCFAILFLRRATPPLEDVATGGSP